MVQGSILGEPPKLVFEMYFVCYLHQRVISYVLNKNKGIRGTFGQNRAHLILQLVNRQVCNKTP